MITKKRLYFVWMVVFVMLVFVGCKEKTGETEITSSEIKDGQKEYVEKALKDIVKKMKPEGPLAKTKKIQRSLAKHILKDHIALMAHFQSGEFDKMIDYLGDAQVYIGEPGDWEVPDAEFWKNLYDNKAGKYLDKEVSIELVIYAVDIPLGDIEPPDDGKDCFSTENFLFKIIAVDENGDVISNQDGGGSRDRFHSGGCPWG